MKLKLETTHAQSSGFSSLQHAVTWEQDLSSKRSHGSQKLSSRCKGLKSWGDHTKEWARWYSIAQKNQWRQSQGVEWEVRFVIEKKQVDWRDRDFGWAMVRLCITFKIRVSPCLELWLSWNVAYWHAQSPTIWSSTLHKLGKVHTLIIPAFRRINSRSLLAMQQVWERRETHKRMYQTSKKTPMKFTVTKHSMTGSMIKLRN